MQKFTPELLATMTNGEIAERLFGMYALDPRHTSEATGALRREAYNRGLDDDDLKDAFDDYMAMHRPR